MYNNYYHPSSNPELVTYTTDGVGSVPYLGKAGLSSSAN